MLVWIYASVPYFDRSNGTQDSASFQFLFSVCSTGEKLTIWHFISLYQFGGWVWILLVLTEWVKSVLSPPQSITSSVYETGKWWMTWGRSAHKSLCTCTVGFRLSFLKTPLSSPWNEALNSVPGRESSAGRLGSQEKAKSQGSQVYPVKGTIKWLLGLKANKIPGPGHWDTILKRRGSFGSCI